MIRIRFVGGDDIVSREISRNEYGFWAIHTEAVMPDGTLLGAHADGGVQARPEGYDNGSRTRDMIVNIPVDEATAQVFHGWLKSQIGKPYDFEAVAAFAAASLVGERDWREPDSWFCSELIAAALSACKWFSSALATQFNHITPRDLLLVVSGRVNVNEGKAS